MFSITIKLMKKSARMLIPAGIAILIGTAFIAATFLFSNSMDDSLRRQRTAQLGEANYIATMKTNSNGAVSENGSADRTTVADFNLDRIRATKGVKGVRVDTSVSVSISAAGKRSNGYAVGTSTDRKLLPVRIVSGDQPVDNNEVALPKSVAKQLGVGVGDKVDVAPISNGSALSGTAVRDVRVVGLTSDPFGVYSFYGGASVLSENVVARYTAWMISTICRRTCSCLTSTKPTPLPRSGPSTRSPGSCRNPMAWNRADRSRRRPSGTSARTTPVSPPYSC